MKFVPGQGLIFQCPMLSLMEISLARIICSKQKHSTKKPCECHNSSLRKNSPWQTQEPNGLIRKENCQVSILSKAFQHVHKCCQREIATLLVDGQQISKNTCRNSSLHKLKHSLIYTFVRYADSVCTLQVNPFKSLSTCSQVLPA